MGKIPDQLHTFENGMNSDNHASLQPSGSYIYALNFVQLSDNGDIYALTNEKGTVSLCSLPAGYKIIGRCQLDKDIILFLVDPITGFSQIGILDSMTNIYTKKAPATGENDDLNLSIDHPIDATARKIFTGDRVVYFTDNFNPRAFLNLDNVPTNNIFENTRISVFNDIPIIDYVNTSEEGGALHCGVYQFVARYKTRELNNTGFGIPCNPIPVVSTKRDVGRDKYQGGYPDKPVTVAKTLNIAITNIDTDFPYLELVAIHYDGLTNTFKAFALPLINIDGPIINYAYDGTIDEQAVEIDLADVNEITVNYDRAKCVEQKDGYLTFSNLSVDIEKFDFQPIANQIVSEYIIDEREFKDSLSSNNNTTFELASNPYFVEQGKFDVYIQFTMLPDPVTSQDINNYLVDYDPSAAGGEFNPVSVIISDVDPYTVIITMDSGDPSQVITEAIELTVSGVKNSDLSQTIATTTEQIILSASSSFNPVSYFTDYKDEHQTFDGKGFRREEVYSFGFGVVWKDGSRSLVYHIPGNDKTSLGTVEADNTTKKLGTFVSTLNYPSNNNYPVGNIRHHKMPTLIQEPHFRHDNVNNKTYIRVLGVKFKNIIIPVQIKEKIQAIYFVRQSRDKFSNRSIIAQGVVNGMATTSNDQGYSSVFDQRDFVWKKVPFFNNFEWTQENFTSLVGTNQRSASFSYATFPDASNLVGAFFSPDTILSSIGVDEAKKIKNVLLLNGQITSQLSRKSRNQTNLFPTIPYPRARYNLYEPLQAWLLGNYTNCSTSFTQSVVDIERSMVIGKETKSDSTFLPAPIDNTRSSNFFAFKTTTPYPVKRGSGTVHIKLKMTGTPAEPFGPGEIYNDDEINIDPNLSNYLYNIYKDNPAQYGALDASEYVFMMQTTNPNATQVDCYQGDTFISKFAYVNKDVWNYKGFYGAGGLVHVEYGFLPSDRGYPGNEDALKGLGLRALGYFFVESNINTNYRHRYIDPITNNLGVKFFPADNAYDVLQEDPRNGDAVSYNQQYSFENNIQLFIGKPAVFNSVSGFETRTIYSQKLVSAEIQDSYRIFPANNFYDLDKNTGEIWDTFVAGGFLYMHTPKCLWKTFLNPVSQQTTDLGTVILGTGGAFTIPSIPVLTDKGGYAGTISQFAGSHTPYGYIFPDALQGKVFSLSGDSLSEISLNGQIQFMDNHLSPLLAGDNFYVDNPFNPNSRGIHGAFDHELKRYVMTKYMNDGSGFTISYSPITKSFISFHSYLPNSYVNIDNKLLGFNNSLNIVDVFQHNRGEYGKFYNNDPIESIVYISINKGPKFDKVFDNLTLQFECTDESTNRFIHLRPYDPVNNKVDTLMIYNDQKHSGETFLKYTNLLTASKSTEELLVRFKGNEYRVSLPENAVIDDTIQIYNVDTGLPVPSNIDQNQKFKGRIKGKYAVVRLSFNNLDNYKLTLTSIASYFRLNSI